MTIRGGVKGLRVSSGLYTFLGERNLLPLRVVPYSPVQHSVHLSPSQHEFLWAHEALRLSNACYRKVMHALRPSVWPEICRQISDRNGGYEGSERRFKLLSPASGSTLRS